MIGLLARRIAWGAVVVWAVATLVFLAYFAAPRDVARLLAGRQASEQTVAAVRVRLGLDQPLPVQYARFLGRLARGDLGESFATQERVADLVLRDLPVSGSLALGGALLWLVLGVGAGLVMAARAGGRLDRALSVVALALYSMPSFLVGQLLLFLLFFQLHRAGLDLFPPGSYVPFTESPLEWARFLALPWLALALVGGAVYARLTRSALLDQLGEEYVRTARAKGLGEGRVLVHHALRASLGPVITQFGIDLGTLLGGAVVTEVVFGLPGLGRELVLAVGKQDLPVIIGTTLVASALVVLCNLLVDLAHAALDPRVRG